MIRGERMSRPAILVGEDGTAEKLNRIPFMSGSFNEAWLQELLANNPFIIPSSDVGNEFAPLVCIGREVPVGSGDTQGYIDNLYVTPSGNIVIVETKLFRNQESRRTVVAQIIDYAKDLQKWDCEKLDEVAAEYTSKKFGQAYRVIDLMARAGHLTYSNEASFTDKVNRSLATANFLLMIIGDGIRTSVQQLADFLNDNTSMSFRLALAEMEIYQNGTGVIVIPNLLSKTSVIERTIITLKDSISQEEQCEEHDSSAYIRKPILSRREFIDAFAGNGGYDPDSVYEFIGDIEAVNGLSIKIAPTELTVRFSPSSDYSYPLLTFGISSGDASIWLVPKRIKAALAKNGVFEFEADPFLDFYRGYVDTKRCKSLPYEDASCFYYANVQSVLDNKKAFISEAEKFAVSIRTNE